MEAQKCFTKNPNDAKFCSACGKSMPASACFCPQCGHSVNAGTGLKSEQATENQQPSHKKVSKPNADAVRSRRIGLTVLLIIGVVIVALATAGAGIIAAPLALMIYNTIWDKDTPFKMK